MQNTPSIRWSMIENWSKIQLQSGSELFDSSSRLCDSSPKSYNPYLKSYDPGCSGEEREESPRMVIDAGDEDLGGGRGSSRKGERTEGVGILGDEGSS